MAYEFRLNRELFDRLCQERGWKTQQETADQLGVSRVTLSMVLTGRSRPGVQFLAGLKAQFPEYSTDDFVSIEQRESEPVK